MTTVRWGLALSIVLWGATGLAKTPAPTDWKTYVNARYAFSVAHAPDAVLEDEAENGDGRHLLSADRALDVAVWGELDALDQGVEGRWQQLQVVPEGGKITYKLRGKGFLVVSGTRPLGDAQIVFYIKVLTDRSGEFATLEATYPVARKADFDPVIARMAKAFKHTARE